MRLLYLLVLLLGSQLACAQGAPASLLPAAASLAPPDTAAALRRLFASRRQRCDWLVGGTLVAGVATAALVVALPTASSGGGGGGGYGSLVSSPPINDQGIKAFAVGVFTVPVVLAELLLAGGWGKKQEQRTIEALQQHRLPRYYKRRLRPRYFPSGAEAPQP